MPLGRGDIDTDTIIPQNWLITTERDGLGCCIAIKAMDHRDLLRHISASVLVIAGNQDVATPLAHSEYIYNHITDAKLVVLEAGHISNLERAAEFSENVIKFLRHVES